ncbi:helix-turn-helix transcriptional regulator [Devosia sp.]|uniref:helix-turn-helix transcriptional regulator n=1 Tax=Devosia sp. TaxID=1871048 RepID=UPI001AC45E3B|nr:helix-turn-helix transcriptional regulator [Devosia sp.]MBN9335422.1 helix-turn-helix transcriptional regulator [Devosia sp.]
MRGEFDLRLIFSTSRNIAALGFLRVAIFSWFSIFFALILGVSRPGGIRLGNGVRYALVERGVDLLFDAAAGMGNWDAGLSTIAAGLGATGAAFIPEKWQVIPLGIPASGNAASAMAEFVTAGWHINDIRARRAWSLVRSERLLFYEQEMATPEERASDPYYQEFFGKYDMLWFMGVAFLVRGARWSLCVYRGDKHGAFHADEGEALYRLRSNLSRILRLAYAFRAPENSTIATILDRASVPMLGFDLSGQISMLTQNAVEAVAPYYRVKGNRLYAVDPAADKSLQAALREATTCLSSAAQREPSAVVAYEAGRPVHVIEIMTMPRTFVDAFGSMVAIGIIRSIRAAKSVSESPSVGALGATFGLTGAEARVACHVGAGLGLPETARKLGIGYETARTHLSRIFAKLGISRQSELVEVLALLNLRGHD